MTDEAKFRELIAKRLEEIADLNEMDCSHDTPLPAWIQGIRDSANFVRRERFPRHENESAKHAEECKNCPRCKHPECRHDGVCNYGGDCGCDYFAAKCECGHTVGAHFDGNMNYQACLHEGCECVEYHSARAKSTLEKINFTDVKPPSNAPDGFSIWYATEVAKARYFKATMAEQSESYSQSDQSEHSSQSPEPQLPDRFPSKSRHGQTVADLLAHMVSIQESNPRVAPDSEMESLFHFLPALWKCEEAECQAFRRLVAPVLSSLLLVLESSHPTHTEHPNSASPIE
jgi:hypothetical protein